MRGEKGTSGERYTGDKDQRGTKTAAESLAVIQENLSNTTDAAQNNQDPHKISLHKTVNFYDTFFFLHLMCGLIY